MIGGGGINCTKIIILQICKNGRFCVILADQTGIAQARIIPLTTLNIEKIVSLEISPREISAASGFRVCTLGGGINCTKRIIINIRKNDKFYLMLADPTGVAQLQNIPLITLNNNNNKISFEISPREISATSVFGVCKQGEEMENNCT